MNRHEAAEKPQSIESDEIIAPKTWKKARKGWYAIDSGLDVNQRKVLLDPQPS